MVKAIKGALVSCDTSIKQIILRLSRNINFVIQDIDENTLFVDQKHLARIEEETNKMLNHIVKKNIE